ncbi:DUF177 domain-containing protein [Gloeocapsa sp. PCC 73106]|uniref:YceD family protein n=1 Tax=Gloeocapsa sp. PCC 73106 TaxID=102232 RepID=UPI0002ABC791|nr:YceD family protein [Gloeocapsa sp. PCC 73106]ELR98020.1 putative metal-binding protein [Gloeocapsa sp. PCC 73106]
MEPIYIPQLLKSPQQTEEITFEELIEGLDTLTPTRGSMTISHRGTYLEVTVTAETIMTLVCDRCLQNYNYRICLNTSELIWLNKPDDSEVSLGGEKEIAFENLSETIPNNGYFQPSTWLYEQLSLAMPVKQLCSKDCHPPEYQNDNEHPIVGDSRWSALAALKQNLQQS